MEDKKTKKFARPLTLLQRLAKQVAAGKARQRDSHAVAVATAAASVKR